MRLSGHFSHGIGREIKKEAVFVSEISAGIVSEIIKKNLFIFTREKAWISRREYSQSEEETWSAITPSLFISRFESSDIWGKIIQMW